MVRGGNFSDSPIVLKYDMDYTPAREFIQFDAFYVRLAASCVQARDFTATFTAFTYAVSGKWTVSGYLTLNSLAPGRFEQNVR